VGYYRQPKKITAATESILKRPEKKDRIDKGKAKEHARW